MRLAVCIVSCIIFNCAQVLIKFILTIEIENEEVRNSNPMKGTSLTKVVKSRAETCDVTARVATKIFEGFGETLFKESIMGWEPVSNVTYTRPGTCINRSLH